MTTSELVKEIYSIVEAKIRSTPSSAEFELAYQARVAIDRIRFAIKQIEQFWSACASARETGLQLADALDRLQTAEHHFQNQFHLSASRVSNSKGLHNTGEDLRTRTNPEDFGRFRESTRGVKPLETEIRLSGTRNSEPH